MVKLKCDLVYTLFWWTQAGKEFVKQARSTERQWSKALQHERSLRTQLEENLEVIAKQMQSLEKEAIVWQESIPPRLDSIGTESGDSSVTYPPHDGHMTYTPGSDDGHMTFPQVGSAYSDLASFPGPAHHPVLLSQYAKCAKPCSSN